MNARTEIPMGLIQALPAQEYHAIKAMSASGLKHMRRSPAHFYGAMLDPRRPAPSTSPAMKTGTLVHCALFEPHALIDRYVVRPAGIDLRTKDGKAWAASVPVGLEIIDAEQMASATAMATAVEALPDVGPLMRVGEPETSAFWTDEATGELCKCRPDWVSPAGDGVILVDGKTCQDASPAGFSRAIWNYRYDLQAAWYSHGYEQATGKRVLAFVFAAVESTWPHAAAAYILDDADLDNARTQNTRLLALYAACKRSGEWPGYPSGVGVLSMPAWAVSEIQPQE